MGEDKAICSKQESSSLELCPPRNILIFLGAVVLGGFSLAAFFCWPKGGWPPGVLVVAVAGLLLTILAVDLSIKRCDWRENGLSVQRLFGRRLYPFKELVLIEFQTLYPKHEQPYVSLILHAHRWRIQLRQLELAAANTFQELQARQVGFILINWNSRTVELCGKVDRTLPAWQRAIHNIIRRIAFATGVKYFLVFVSAFTFVTLMWQQNKGTDRIWGSLLFFTVTVLLGIWTVHVVRVIKTLCCIAGSKQGV